MNLFLMKKIKILILLYCILFFPNIKAQEVLTLSDCIQKALDANFGIKIAKNEEQIAKNNVNFRTFLPSIYADATQREAFNNSKRVDANGNESVFKNTQNDNLNASVNLQWTLFDGCYMFVSHNKMKELAEMGELNTQWQVENLVANVTAAYYNIWIQTQLLEATENIIEISKMRFKIAQDKYAIGSMSGLDMRRSKIDLNADSSLYMKQQEMVARAYIQLNTLINGPLEKLNYVKDTLILLPLLDYGQIKQQVLDNNLSLSMAKKGVRISELDLKMIRSSYFPVLQFNPGYQFSIASTPAAVTTYNRTNGFYWGFSLHVPIFSQNTVRTQAKNAKLNIQNSELSYQELELTVLSNLAELFASYQNNHQLLAFEVQNMEVTYETLQSAIERYRIGTLSGLEFRDFQRSYIDALTRKMTAAYQAKVSEIAILLLAGKLK